MDEKPRILGVDDSLTIRKALELVLKPGGYTLELAASGAEAVDKARWFRPAAVLLDFILPDMRGTEVCRRLSADPETASIPVILISAKGAEIRQAYEDVSNVVGYVAKPFTPEAILEVIGDVVARSARGELGLPATRGSEDRAPAMAANGNGFAAHHATGKSELAPARIEPFDSGRAPDVRDARTPVHVEAWEDADAEEGVAESAREELADDERRRESLETMLEALSAGMEGVYVEEVDTSAGAAIDESKSYTDLVAQLNRQLGEALAQANSGARFALTSDGSIRSLDDVLFDAYRRVCRLLFRAAADGAVAQGAPAGQPRVLVVCHRDSASFGALGSAIAGRQGWHGFLVSERFRQLPILTRLYGPTHVVVDLASSAAVWDQLRAVSDLPERRRIEVIGVAPAGTRLAADARGERDVDAVIACGPRLLEDLERRIGGAAAADPSAGSPAIPELALSVAS